MAYLIRPTNAGTSGQLTDIGGTAADGCVWTPHPSYIGTIRNDSAKFVIFSNPLDTDPALYLSSASEVSTFTAEFGVARFGAAAVDNSIGFCYFVQRDADSYYRVRYNGTDWLLEKVIEGVPTTLGTVTGPDPGAGTSSVGTYTRVYVYVRPGLHYVYITPQGGASSRTVIVSNDTDLDSGLFGLWGSGGGASAGSSPTHYPTNGVAIGYANLTSANPAAFLVGETSLSGSVSFTSDSEIESSGYGEELGSFECEFPGTITSEFESLLGPPPVELDAELPAVFGGSFTAVAGNIGDLELVSRTLTGEFTGRTSNNATFELETKPFTGSFTAELSDLQGTFPRPWSASFTASALGGASLVAVAPPLSGDFTATATILGSMELVTKLVSGSFSVRLSYNEGMQLTLTKPYITLTAAAAPGEPIVLRTPSFEGSFSGHVSVSATMAGSLPNLIIALSSLGISSTLAETLVLNTRSFAHSNYTYGFVGYAEFNNKLLGIKSDGIYELDTGEDDGGTAISASFATGLADFGSPNLKHLDAFYSTFRTDGDLQLTVSTDEGTAYNYNMSGNGALVLKQRRVLVGRGLRGKNWKYTVSNLAGADFEVDSIDLIVKITKRGV